jgi:hypothetical protein
MTIPNCRASALSVTARSPPERALIAEQFSIPGRNASRRGIPVPVDRPGGIMPGPIPQRSDQTVRNNAPIIPIDTIEMEGNVEVPQLDFPDPRIHPIALDWYKSLAKSGQSKYYEPSDWQYARVVAYFLDDILNSPRPSPSMLATLQMMFTSLLCTEGDRRRVRIEIQRKINGEKTEEAKIIQMSDIYRERLKGQQSG